MLWIFAVALALIVAFAVIGLAMHLLFSPWLLAVVAIVALIKFWPRRSRR
jgi:hypothetical protein